MQALPTLHALVADARRRLHGAGIPDDEAGFDARLLAQWVMDWDAARLIAALPEPPPAGFAAKYNAVVARRAAREPVAYITGQREFWNLLFEVSPAVLIPRPETELIVESALERFPNGEASLSICDVCTGSGCVAIALAHDRPRATLVGTDVSPEALVLANRNAEHHRVGGRVRFVPADLLHGLDESFDLIVSNPPYVPDSDRSLLQPEVRDYEPSIALFAGPEGLSVIRRLLDQSIPRLKPGGLLMFEFGFGQDHAVAELIATASGLEMVALAPDLQGIPRVAIAKRTNVEVTVF